MTRRDSKTTARARIAAALSFAAVCMAVVSPGLVHAAPKTGVVAGSGTSAGGVFTAGTDGAEYMLPSRARLQLSPGASVRIFPVPQPLQLSPGPKTTTHSFALLRGRADVIVPARPKSAVLCSIGKLSAVITPGRATLIARSADKATVASVEGDVRTLWNERWQTLLPGTVARFGPAHSGVPETALTAPRLSPGPRLWLSPGAPVAISGFDFQPVAGAELYELRLRTSDGKNEQVRRVTGATRLTEAFAPVAAGDYQITLRSVDAEGIAGKWSAPEVIRVVGVTLPPGGYAAGGDIFIGKGQQVSFSHTDGLEMTYEGAGRYVPASQSVSLYRDETTVVSFRVPGSVFPTSARLRPRNIYAQVTMGPSRAVWPTDPVEIAVELKTRGGLEAPPDLELRPEVKLGIEPIDVAFTRRGSRLVGVVLPIDKPGPWVLRVEVRDQFGALLGHDFLEIGRAAALPPREKTAPRVASK